MQRTPAGRTAPEQDAAGSARAISGILQQVRRIELRTRRLVSALAAGGYRSTFRGQGMEFDQVREYVEGDDVRTIRLECVTARAGRPWVKLWREERELTALVVVDTSASMRFGAIPGISTRAKLALAAEAAAIIAVIAMRNQDRVGLRLVSDRTELHLPPRRGRGHALRLVREVLLPARPLAGRSTDLCHALLELGRTTRRRSLIFLISDFIGASSATGVAPALARLTRRHELVAVRVCDPGEESLPGTGVPLVLEDPEGGGQRVLRGSAAVAQEYQRRWQDDRRATAALVQGAGCDLVDCRTDRGAAVDLMRYLRGGRRVRG